MVAGCGCVGGDLRGVEGVRGVEGEGGRVMPGGGGFRDLATNWAKEHSVCVCVCVCV